ncbi:hypothetical protein [Haloarcula sp. H-GB5]|jgi:hypothetical protein
MNSMKTLTAREAYHDCLQFFEKTIRPSMEIALSNGTFGISFSGRVDPCSDFEVKVTATHAALVAFVKRYPSAEFKFHSERNRIPGVSDAALKDDPLNTQYVVFTMNFTPYGTMFGGSSDNDGGNKTFAKCGESESAGRGEIEESKSPGPMEVPSGPSGPTNTSSPVTPATA